MFSLDRPEPPPATGKIMRSNELGFVLQTLRRFRWHVCLVGFLMVGSAIFGGFSFAMVLPIIDMLLGAGSDNAMIGLVLPLLRQFSTADALLVASGGLLLLMTIQYALKIIQAGCTARFTGALILYWRRRIYETYLHGERAYLVGRNAGELLDSIASHPAHAAKFFKEGIALVTEAVFALVMASLILISSWQLTLIVLAIFGFMILVIHRPLRRLSRAIGRDLAGASLAINASASETISGIREVRTLSLQRRQMEELVRISARQVSALVRQAVINALPEAVTQLTIMALLVGCIIYAAIFSSGNITTLIPTATLFVLVAQRLSRHVSNLLQHRVNMLSLRPSVDIVDGLISLDVAREQADRGIAFGNIGSDVVFSNVSFSYGAGGPVLRKVDLRIPKSRITCLVGPSGSGKSTLVDLLMRLYTPEAGEILVNGRSLNDFSIDSWRRATGYVGQEPFLFHATVRENIMLGNPAASDRVLVEATKAAHAHGFVMALEHGFDTVVGSRGGRISGGQRQRLAIARALIRDPDLLIFDEATSSLDPESKSEVLRILAELREAGKTILYVTHNYQDLGIADAVLETVPEQNGIRPWTGRIEDGRPRLAAAARLPT